MPWNYRVVETEHASGGYRLAIHEVYYGSKGELLGYTEGPAGIVGDDQNELIATLGKILRGVSEPVLRPEDFKA